MSRSVYGISEKQSSDASRGESCSEDLAATGTNLPIHGRRRSDGSEVANNTEELEFVMCHGKKNIFSP
ncbi:hypothetical protein ACP4OV_030725 [Aristida adscensionis]